jgi:hypothetical protein
MPVPNAIKLKANAAATNAPATTAAQDTADELASFRGEPSEESIRALATLAINCLLLTLPWRLECLCTVILVSHSIKKYAFEDEP